MILLDTDFVIALTRNDSTAQEKLNQIKNEKLAISSVTIMELEFGFQKINKKVDIKDFTQNYLVIPFDSKEAMETAKIQVELQKSGNRIGAEDEMIAATANVHNAVLLTRNIKHFKRIKGLKTQTW